MDGENILTFNFANWVTVLLMVIVTFFLWGTVGRLVHAKTATPATETTV